ncbi:GIY-YIG nuclease family protein, partial [Escherichia coli]|uniref:GIY-YIG nuclease family protein n=1 Tax=Escherichia coli TaxID=562 RepID=UPI001324569E
IISNIGSFGENVYKIGMTQRLDLQDRVNELGDASVPFIFDVHAMIYSEDAPSLEKKLHDVFDKKRVNLVNRRKEFFYVTLDEIKEALKKHSD